MGRGSKFKGPATVGGVAPVPNGDAVAATATAAGTKKQYSGMSDELRQAVLDLGGGEEDFDLIDGVDEEDDVASASAPVKPAKKTENPEKDLKKALGDFMKGLDFAAAGAQAPAIVDVEEVASEDDSQDDEDDEDEDEEEDEEEDSEDDDEETGEDDETDEEEEEADESEEEDEEDEEDEQNVPAARMVQPVPKKQPVPAAPVALVDPNATSGSIVPPTPNWTTLLPPLAPLNSAPPALPTSKLQSLRSRGSKLLEDLPPLSRKTSSSDAAFINQILASGTHQDKLSALVLLVRESPVHAVKELNKLRGMTGHKDDGAGSGPGAGGGNKDQRVAVCKALVDWWVTGGGKEQGKLKYFSDQPLLAHPQITDRHLLVFAFEDWLKKWFFNLLQVLEVLSHDPLPYIRVQALQMVFRLLEGNAEQEQNLLRLGVNKLGDTDRSVASKTSHRLLQLLQIHPAMKAIIAREVSSLVLKPSPGASSSSSSHVRFDDGPSASSSKSTSKAKVSKTDGPTHARYYGLITLNQITLSAKTDRELAGKLVQLYFEVFREILGEADSDKEEGGDKEHDQLEKAVGKVGKWQGRRKRSDKGKKNGKQQQQEQEDGVDGDQARMVAGVLTGIKRAMPYARLEEEAFAGYLDTLFKITHIGTFNTSVQALALIFQVAQAQSQVQLVSNGSSVQASNGEIGKPTAVKSITDRFYRTLYDSLLDPRLLSSSKQAMYLNLLFDALKVDAEIKRTMAFVKRLCQVFTLAGVPFLSGALFLLGELFNAVPGLKRMLIEPEDDGEEHFVDAPEEGQEKAVVPDDEVKKPVKVFDTTYDGKKREPLYAHADTSCLWEIIPLTQHYHPSISLLSTQLLLSQPLSGSADISGNTLIAFLDKFVYRNPKKNVLPKGASVMQPAAANLNGDGTAHVRLTKGAKTEGEVNVGVVNSEPFWKKKVGDVPVDQLFFHKYFSSKLAQKEKSKKKGGKGGDSDDDDGMASDEGEDEDVVDEEDDDEEEEEEDAEEDEIWKAMQASMPGVDDDLGLSDDSEDEEDEDVDYDESASEDESIEDQGEGAGEDEEVDDVDEEGDSDDDDDAIPGLSDEEDDLLSLDELDEDAMPNIVLDGGDDDEDEEDEEADADTTAKGKRKRQADDRKERKRKRKALPLFGDYETWQKIIEEGGNDGDEA